MKTILHAAVALLILVGGTDHAYASAKVRCEVLTISASNSSHNIDPELAKYTAMFRQPPFTAFNSYRLVNRKHYELALGIPSTLKLPETFKGALRFNQEDKGQFELTLTIARLGKKAINIRGRASPNAPFFTAGFKSPGGVWVFGVLCNKGEIVNH